jgi:hypothetical protein
VSQLKRSTIDHVDPSSRLFSGKNTLVILLQLYRLYVVQSESSKANLKKKKLKHQQDRARNSRGSRGRRRCDSSGDVYIISNEKSSKHKKRYEKAS